MPRGRRKSAKNSEEKAERNEYMCCGKGGKILTCGLALILLGFAIKIGFGLADMLLLIGAIFVIKGMLMGAFKK